MPTEQKTLEKTITDAWQRQAWWLWLLLPLMLLYWLGHSVHKCLYALGIKKSYKADIPVFVIGNITVGGSGKTPLLIALVKQLQEKGIKVAVISRGYGSQQTHSRFVEHESLPNEVGDEPCLIKQNTGVTLCVGRDRAESIRKILHTYPTTQIILCDDGLQHYKLCYDHAWIVYDVKRGIGNGMLLPVGFLREWSSRLSRSNSTETVIEHVAEVQHASRACFFSLHVQKPYPLFLNQASENPITHKKIHAVTGIGYPTRFFDTLTDQGYEVVAHAYPDHYYFTEADLHFTDALPIIITAKDAVKVRQLELTPEIQKRIWVLPVEAKLSPASLQHLDLLLDKLL